jgi:dihydrofolate reductase
MIYLIAAMTKERVIGKDGTLPWNIPEEMKFFRATVKDSVIIMGRKTYESVGRPFPNRPNIVVTTQDLKIEGCEVFHDIQYALEKAKTYGKDIAIIGGSTIYRQTIPLADKMILTYVKKYYEGDTFFPDFDESEWDIEKKEECEEYDIVYYKRKATTS